MILIGLGANLPSPVHGTPRKTLSAALEQIARSDVHVVALSDWYSSAPVPASSQPRYVNAVAVLETKLEPGPLLQLLHDIEREFGRERSERNAARMIDIDLLDHDGLVQENWPVLPHPRLAERAFVLRPLRDVCPEWRHPLTDEGVDTLLAGARDRADIRPVGAGKEGS
ncbi:MAG: 2-amino-4-hydroxy-6-hydroxymethyldihydropteridine diphosphokinase [Alphaproteobacteria bacterium]|nr:2-amino-4-hydroxy-6-hydroxymethyldihydropteridine diphosphokinase [Alphaproteobacteria bacterium]